MQADSELEARYTYMIKNGSMVKAPDYESYSHSSSQYSDAIKNNEYTISMLEVDGLGI